MACNLKKRYSNSLGWTLDGLSVTEACAKLKELEEEVLAIKGVTEVTLNWDQAEWEDGYLLYLVGYGPETEGERRIREKNEKELNLRREKRERAELERLRKKYK